MLDRGNRQERRATKETHRTAAVAADRRERQAPEAKGGARLTRVVNMKLVDDALVTAAENYHEILNCNRPVAVPGSRLGPRRICDPLPL